MKGQGKYVGEGEIMARLKMPWRHVCALVEHERLLIRWIDGRPVLTVADLERWEGDRQK